MCERATFCKLVEAFILILYHDYSYISFKYHDLRNDSIPPNFTESVPPRGTHRKQCFCRLFQAKFIQKRLLAVIVLSNIVEVFVHFRTKLQAVKRVKVRDVTVFRGTYKFDNF